MIISVYLCFLSVQILNILIKSQQLTWQVECQYYYTWELWSKLQKQSQQFYIGIPHKTTKKPLRLQCAKRSHQQWKQVTVWDYTSKYCPCERGSISKNRSNTKRPSVRIIDNLMPISNLVHFPIKTNQVSGSLRMLLTCHGRRQCVTAFLL